MLVFYREKKVTWEKGWTNHQTGHRVALGGEEVMRMIPREGWEGVGGPPLPSLDGPPCIAGNEWRDYKTDRTSR